MKFEEPAAQAAAGLAGIALPAGELAATPRARGGRRASSGAAW